MNNYIYSIIISKLDIKSIINLSETNKDMYYLIKKSNYAGILWNKYFNSIKLGVGDITDIKTPDNIFKLCAIEKFNNEKNISERCLSEYFYYLTNNQIRVYLNSKKCK